MSVLNKLLGIVKDQSQKVSEGNNRAPALNFSIAGISPNDGMSLELGPGEILIVVGANNCGKTTFLKEVRKNIKSESSRGKVVKRVSLRADQNPDPYVEWVKRTHQPDPQRSYYDSFVYSWGKGSGVDLERWRYSFAQRVEKTEGFADLTKLLVVLHGAADRLDATRTPEAINYISECSTSPIHSLAEDESLEDKFDLMLKEAFGLRLFLNRVGRRLPLLVGRERPKPLNDEDRASASFLRRLSTFSELEQEGDGIRSFIGTMLLLMTCPAKVHLIDEPEVFLHPPQARLLGRFMVDQFPKDKQLILATHSADILRGILESSGADRVAIARIQRDSETDKVEIRRLARGELKNLWADPSMHYSNALDGIFSEISVLCEADADCRFYSAVADALETKENGKKRSNSVHFVPVGGKSRLALVAKALADLGVVVRVVADIDLLESEEELKRVVGALGGNWAALSDSVINVRTSIENSFPVLNRLEAREEIMKLLAASEGQRITSKEVNEIRALLKRVGSWSVAKTTGISCLKGTGCASAVNLFEMLEAVGLFIVRVGELEMFVRSESGKGSAWLARVLERNLIDSPDLKDAREFVTRLIQ